MALVHGFVTLARERRGYRVGTWLAEVVSRALLSMLRAGRTAQWGNEPTKGFVHKLKLLKRQSSGHADFAMLR